MAGIELPIVSVIIPTYNRKELVRQAVQSVFQQTYHNYEVIVVDDGSTDGTADVLDRVFGRNIRFVAIEHSGLPAVARNAGISAALGHYVAFLDSDDLWTPEKLDLQISALNRDQKYGWSFGNVICFGPAVRKEALLFAPWRIRSGSLFTHLLRGNFIPASTVVVRKELLDRVGYFDLSPDLRSAEDFELWLRLAWQYPALGFHQPLARYRVFEGNISKVHETHDGAIACALRLAHEKLKSPEHLRRRANAALLVTRFRHTIGHDDIAASGYLLQARKLDPFYLRSLWYWVGFRIFGASAVAAWLSFETNLKRHFAARKSQDREPLHPLIP